MSETITLPTPADAKPQTNGAPPWPPGYEASLPNLDELVTQDDEPVDNFYVEILARLLVESLKSSWRPGRPFVAATNVGWFHTSGQRPVVPDVMVSLGVAMRDPGSREGRSYFQWIIGKPPDLAVEFVSDKRAGEFDGKLNLYERLGLPYFVVHDPDGVYDRGPLCAFELRGGKYAAIDPKWLPNLGLGVTLWEGEHESLTRDWLRWCDRDGVLIPTGLERAETAEGRADDEARRADAAEERVRLLLAELKARG